MGMFLAPIAVDVASSKSTREHRLSVALQYLVLYHVSIYE